VLATAVGCGAPLALLLAGGEGSWRAYWTLFGTSNQLLAALTLLAVTLWLKKEGRACWFTFLPMLFVLGMTTWSLVIQLLAGFKTGATAAQKINGGASLVLLALAGFLAIEAVGALRRPREAAAAS
jgi:carbon starvation protein